MHYDLQKEDLPELVQGFVVFETGGGKGVKEPFLVYFEVLAEGFEAGIEVAQLHVYPAHEHYRVFRIVCHFHSIL